MTGKVIQGVLPVAQTPFDDEDRIDFAALEREVDWVFEVGADGIGTGMVSEILRLTAEERDELGTRLVACARGRGPVFLSVGAESTREAVANAERAERAGCDAVMAIPPVTTALSERHFVDYFRALVEAVDVPVIVQDASSYVGQSIPLAVCVDLLERYGAEKVLFKPEAAPLGPNLSALRDATDGRARIYEGSGGIMLIDSFRRGVAGTMPGVDLLDGIVALWQALARGEEERAYRLYFPICALVALEMQAGADGFLAVEKHLLVKRGLFTSPRRRPPYRWELDAETEAEVERLFGLLQKELASS